MSGLDTRLVDEVCPEHGFLAHVFVHEAAHAVAAVQLGIRFVEVRVLAPAAWVAYQGGRRAGGVVMTRNDPVEWVSIDLAGSFQFVMAGSVAEFVILGHYMPRSWLSDIELWCRGAGATEPLPKAGIDSTVSRLLGIPMSHAISNAVQWADENMPAIRSVAAALAGNSGPVGGLAHSEQPPDDSWGLREGEVMDLVGARPVTPLLGCVPPCPVKGREPG